MNVNKVLTMNYEEKDTWWTGKKRTQTNPNKANFPASREETNPIQTQYKPNFKTSPAPKIDRTKLFFSFDLRGCVAKLSPNKKPTTSVCLAVSTGIGLF